MVVRIKMGSGANAPNYSLKQYLKAKRRHAGLTGKVMTAGGADVVIDPVPIASKKKRKKIIIGGIQRDDRDTVIITGTGQMTIARNGKIIEQRTKIRDDVREAALAAAALTQAPHKR